MEEAPREKRKRVNNSRFVVQMELRAKSEPKEFEDFNNEAHQFSYRSKSVQADDEEKEEIAI